MDDFLGELGGACEMDYIVVGVNLTPDTPRPIRS